MFCELINLIVGPSPQSIPHSGCARAIEAVKLRIWYRAYFLLGSYSYNNTFFDHYLFYIVIVILVTYLRKNGLSQQFSGFRNI